MAKINKTLSSRVDRATGKSEVMIRFVAARLLTLRARTGLFVPPERWNEKTGDVRISTIKTPEQKELLTVQRQLAELSNLILERFSSTEIEEVTKAWLEQVIDEFHHPEKYHAVEKQARVVRKQTVLKYLDRFIEETPQRRHKQTGRLLSTSTPRVYKTMRRHLFEFARTIRKKDFEFDEIDMKFYNRLVIYLQAKQFTANTVGKIIKELKAVLRQAEKDGVNPNTAYKDFTVYTEAVDNVYLSEEELEKIRTADLNVKPQEVKKLIAGQNAEFEMLDDDWRVYGKTLEKVRDWFLLLAWTGSRFSDLEKISQQEVGTGFISFRQQKTNTKVVIPVHPVVHEILERYGYAMPPAISNQKFNHDLKIVCLLAGINNMESKTRTEGGVLKTTVSPKWMLVSSHTGRRSFCTNMYKRGLPTLTIMAISGHTTEKSFLRYIKVTQEEHAQLMKEQWTRFYK
nr:MAG TPA: Integrase [Caudoviricetes sp.]